MMEQKRIEVTKTINGATADLGHGIIMDKVVIPRGIGGYDCCACTGYIVKMDSGSVFVIKPEDIKSFS